MISLAASPVGLRSVVDALRFNPHNKIKVSLSPPLCDKISMPSPVLSQEMILDTLFSVFGVPIPQNIDSWTFSSQQDSEQLRVHHTIR